MSQHAEGVVILHNVPRAGGPAGCRESDEGILVQVRAVSTALDELGIAHRIAGIRRLDDVPAALAGGSEQVVVNLVESLDGDVNDVNFVPAVCRALGRSPTGNDAVALQVCLDKAQAKAAFEAAGVPTPEAFVVPVGARPPSPRWTGRAIVKPLRTDASEGIDASSVVGADSEALAGAVARVHERFAQPALVERFLQGREVNVSIIQRGSDLCVLPPAEIDFSAFPPDKPRIVDYAAKWLAESFEYNHTPRRFPARVSQTVHARIVELSKAAWRAASCQDYARVDFRLDEADNPFVIEVNPNPDISPDAGFAAALGAGGVPYAEFVRTIVENAAGRFRSAHREPAAAGAPKRAPGRSLIRRSEPADRDTILDFMARTNFFQPGEMEVAREVLDEALAHGPEGHYQSYTALLDDRVVGWVCFGPTPCTAGTFDLYWIAVDPATQGQGVGADLMALAEQEIAARGGRLVVVETSGRPSYRPTRQFYLRIGYREDARVPDFYSPGDDRVIYTKRIPESA